MRSDIVLALRRLRRAPIFTLFSIVTLALAIGVVTAVYSLIRSGLRTELSIGDASSVVMIAKRSSMTDALYPASLSWPDYQDLIQQTDVFQSTAAWTTFTNALVVGDSSEIVFGELVSGDYFATIGLHAERGRLIDSGDDRPGAPAVAVLSASAWRRRFARDPRAVGSTIRLAGRPFEVIGIAPESFRGLRPLVRFASPDVWVPLSHARALAPSWARQDRGRRDHTWLNVVGRLSAGRQMADAERQVQMLSDRIDAAEPLPDLGVGNGTYVKQQRHWYALAGDERANPGGPRDSDMMRAILLLPALVLIVACTNLGNLALSRGISRRSEFAVRLAIGASRWQLVRGQLIEYGIVSLLGGLGALVIASRLTTVVAATVRSAFGDAPQYRIDAYLNTETVVAVGIAAVASLLVAGLIPALQLTRRRPARDMVADQAGGSSPRWRGRSNLIALQMSVSVALLLVAALCVRQLPKLDVRGRTGASFDRVGVVRVPFATQSIAEDSARLTIDRILGAARGLPGTVAVAAASDRRLAEILDIAPEGSEFGRGLAARTARRLSVTPVYFQTIGLRLVSGRAFDPSDAAGSPAVAVVNESQARTLFGDTNVVGRRLQVRSGASSPIALVTIVGVAGDIHDIRGTHDSVDHLLYMPLAQRFEDNLPIEVLARARDAFDPAAVATSVRAAVRQIDPTIAVAFVGRADAAEVGPAVILRYFTIGFGSLAFLALAFAMSGLYGVLDHVVSRRTREFGVRAALGADPARLIRLIVKDGSRPVLEGIVLGFGMAAGARVGMQGWFTQPVTAVDPVALVIALVPLATAAALACYLPARRAARVDPNVALRHL